MDADQLKRFLVGRLLVNALVAELFPHATGWLASAGACQRCGELHAGVELEGVPARASVSYAANLVVVAVAPTSLVSRLGVDVETADIDHQRALDLRRLLGASSEPVLRRWTRVEAVLKADGRGLLVDPGAVHLRQGGAWLAGESVSYVVAEVDGPPGYLISVAWCTTAPSGTDPEHNTRRLKGPAGARWSRLRTAAPVRVGRSLRGPR
jgi:4'-phosphopantetheinyl transferase